MRISLLLQLQHRKVVSFDLPIIYPNCQVFFSSLKTEQISVTFMSGAKAEPGPQMGIELPAFQCKDTFDSRSLAQTLCHVQSSMHQTKFIYSSSLCSSVKPTQTVRSNPLEAVSTFTRHFLPQQVY